LSIQDQIRALEQLAALDAELRILDEQLSQERTALEGLKGNIAKLDAKLDGDRATLATMDKSRGELIVDVRNMTQQLEHSREKLNRSRTEREANAAQRELEELRKLVRDREEEIGKLTAGAEAARQGIEATEEEHRKLTAELEAREGDIRAKLGEIGGQRDGKHAEREHASKALPVPLYRRYEMIRNKKGFAVAQTTDGTCRACNMSLPPQLFHRLRREPILDQCPSCQRIIYYVAPVVAASPATPART
jgi:predicted  nucleic acid-binding Zn-ribbon protein